MCVVSAQANPVARGPLRGDVAVDVGAVLVFRRQFGEVGAVFAETLGDAQVGLEQGGIEGPVQRFDVGIAPHAIVAAQALATEAQLLAWVGGKAAVADPELAHGQVAFVWLTAVVAGVGAGAIVVLAQGVGFDGVGRSDRLAHGVGTPVTALAVHPRAQIQAQAVDVAARAGAQVTVVFRLAGDFHVQAEVFFSGHFRQGRAGPQQGEAQADASFHEGIERHSESSPSTSFSSSCKASRARVLFAPCAMLPRARFSWSSSCWAWLR
ncbi:hypothetical protein D3C79_594990 [compost metagenome]